MNRTDKSLIVGSLVEKFKQYDSFCIIDATKLPVSLTNQFKLSCAQQGLHYKVAKNTLILRAFSELPELHLSHDVLREQVLIGFSGILFFNQDASIPAKVIKAFRKSQSVDRPLLKGAYVERELFFLGDSQLDVLTQYKPKQVLIGEIIALLQSPTGKVLAALKHYIEKMSSQPAVE